MVIINYFNDLLVHTILAQIFTRPRVSDFVLHNVHGYLFIHESEAEGYMNSQACATCVAPKTKVGWIRATIT